jgi:hypothetical protein
MDGVQANNTSDLDHLFPERQIAKGVRAGQTVSVQQTELMVDQDDGAAPIGTNTLLIKGVCDHLDTTHKSIQTRKRSSIRHRRGIRCFVIDGCHSWGYAAVSSVPFPFQAVVNILLIFPMSLPFALLNCLIMAVLYFYIGHFSPGTFPGITEFSIKQMIGSVVTRIKDGAPEAGRVRVLLTSPDMCVCR